MNINSFDSEMRRRAQQEDCPVPEGFQTRMAQTLSKLPEKKRTVPRRLAGRIAAVAAAALLVTSAVAASPTLQDVLESFMGEFLPYGQPLEEGVSVTDQGVTVRLVSAMADQGMARVIVEVSGDLGGTLPLGKNGVLASIFWAQEEGSAGGSVGKTECIAVDPEQGTCLVESRLWSDGIHGGRNMEFQIWKLFPNQKEASGSYFEEGIDLSGAAEASCLELEGETVLKPGQGSRALPGMEDITISAVGYDSEGALHVQYQMPEGTIPEECRVVSTLYQRGGDGSVLRAHGMEQGEQQTFWAFALDGTVYVDQKFTMATEDRDGWSLASVILTYSDAPHLEGDWTLEFEVPALPERTIQLGGETAWSETTRVEGLTLTPWSVRLTGFAQQTLNEDVPCFAILQDGSRVEAHGVTFYHIDFTGRWEEERTSVGFWEFDAPVETSEITAVEIGGRHIALTGETTGTIA